mmetsp:Transcript_25663/g.29360  ORF Transcript_25663/g.29360 Transcript_25663/m.29360 type:complete len:542 (-) Transcript_25663:1-1626(-)
MAKPCSIITVINFFNEMMMAIRKYPLKTIQIIIILGAAVSCGGLTYFSKSFDNHSWLYKLGEASGNSTYFLVPIVFFSFLRGILSRVPENRWFRLISFDIDVHIIIAVFLTVVAVLHTVSWGVESLDYYTDDAGITGWLMNATLLGPLVVTLPWFRNRLPCYYWTYLTPHKIAALIFLLAFTGHTTKQPGVIILSCVGGFIFVVLTTDRVLLYTTSRYRVELTKRTCILDQNTLRLSVHRPKALHYKAGYYSSVSVPSIGILESHPLSICSGEDDQQIEFVVRVAGVWTQRLYRAISLNEFQGPVHLRAAFPEKAITHAMNQSQLMFISAGVGMTPFLSMIRSLKGERSIIGHVTTRNVADFSEVFEATEAAEKQGIPVKLYLYYTGTDESKKQEIRNMILQKGWNLAKEPYRVFPRRKPRAFDLASRSLPQRTQSLRLNCLSTESQSIPLEVFDAETSEIRRRSFAFSFDSQRGSYCQDNISLGEDPSVQLSLFDHRMEMSEVLACDVDKIYFVGPPGMAQFLNSECVKQNRKLFYSTWS